MKKRCLAIIFVVLTIVCLPACSNSLSNTSEQQNSNGSTGNGNEIKEKNDELVPFAKHKPSYPPQGNKASYDIDLKMNPDGIFKANASIEITNTSGVEWDTIQFYFIPNIFTKEFKPSFIQTPSEATIHSVHVNEKIASYTVEYDTLEIDLSNPLKNKQSINVAVSYSFTVPEHGMRFSKAKNNYYLAQWYPMIATYQSGWNKMDYNTQGESYHTDFSDFVIHYDIPKGFTVYSTADQEEPNETTEETLTMNQVKEFYLAITKTDDMIVKKDVVRDTEIRLIGYKQDKDFMKEVLSIAISAFDFFEKNIGAYPHQQLDIILDEGGMEYPGIVTIGDVSKDFDAVDNAIIIAHEIGHQWFYGVVSNDPYLDAWVDEGITEFASSLFIMDHMEVGTKESLGFMYNYYKQSIIHNDLLEANLPLDKYKPGSYSYGASVYVQPTLELHKQFQTEQGNETALAFLRSYYEQYQYKEVTTEELLHFLKAYLRLDDVSVFADWIKFQD